MRDAFGEIDPDEVDRNDSQPGTEAGKLTPTATRRRSRAVAAATVGAVTAIGAIGVAVWRLSGDDETKQSESTVAVEVLTDRLVIATPPDGFRLSSSFISGTSAEDGEFALFTDQRTEGLVLARDGATLDDGPLLAFYASTDERFAAEADLDDQEGEAVDINGLPGRYVDEGSELLLTFGPDDDGYLYFTVGIGVPRAQLEAFARAIDVDGGLPTIRDPEAIDGFDVIADINTFFSVLSPMLGLDGSGDGNAVVYEDSNGASVTLTSASDPGNALSLFSLLGETSTIEIAGSEGFVTEMAGDFGGGTLISRVVDGRLIMVAGNVSDDELAAAAASVRPATDDEWQAVLDVARAGDSNVGGG